ncbi:hypothetical protein A0128_18520 [Leptospira tipperaryensis]|uniref:Uncharacterized protein n=1 Tax=Leptospira tipperaryensis TaxID=2564040 RepID=A0A1D7V1D8_9LEPT|nr:hypothetical protein A0128_18520 [Leptospira tipperaryensis]
MLKVFDLCDGNFLQIDRERTRATAEGVSFILRECGFYRKGRINFRLSTQGKNKSVFAKNSGLDQSLR